MIENDNDSLTDRIKSKPENTRFELENPYKNGTKPDPYIRNSFIMLGVGVQLFATVIIFIYIGIYFDKKLETTNFLSLVGGIVGILVGLFNFFKLVKRFGVGGTEYDE